MPVPYVFEELNAIYQRHLVTRDDRIIAALCQPHLYISSRRGGFNVKKPG